MKLDRESIRAWLAKCGTVFVTHPLTGPIINLFFALLMLVPACFSEPGTFAREWGMLLTGIFVGFSFFGLTMPQRLQSLSEKQQAHYAAEFREMLRHIMEEMKPQGSILEVGPDGELRVSQKPKAH